jgi:hypothetical protein
MEVLVPFELKTGLKEHPFYGGQVLLYTMMLYEHDLATAEKVTGLLYYNRLDK